MNVTLMPLVTGAEVAFWVGAPIAVLGALGLVMFRKAVYSALSMAVTMIALAVLYASMDAPFLAMVQIIVYTGAILMMFLFVIMMVGMDHHESVVEPLKGQRPLAVLAGIGVAALLILGIAGAVVGTPKTVTEANLEFGTNAAGLANLLFGRYMFVFELSAALLITSAVGAMLLAHHDRVFPHKGQRQRAADRMHAYATRGEHPGPLPNSGVYATTNSIGAPALLPDGTIAEKSLSQTLVMRGATMDAVQLRELTSQTFAAVEAVRDEDEEDAR